MNSLRVIRRKAGYIATAFAFALAIVVPVLASAAQVTDRSIALSSSSKDASGVTYTINFTAQSNGANAFVVDFCNDSPFIGDTCTPPPGFSATSAASTTSGFTDVTPGTSQFIVAASSAIAKNDDVSVEVTGIHNPSSAGVLYARIVSYDSKADAIANYTSDDLGDPADVIDSGSIAISINDTIGVSAAVLESMTFCVSGSSITATNCGGSLSSPALKLGSAVGSTGVIALTPNVVSSGDIFTQLSTNAASGAIVSLKSSTTGCGGLVRSGDANCDIKPAQTTDIVDGGANALFGVKTGADSGAPVSGSGTFAPITGSHYNATTYALNYTTGDTAGVTSTYGDPFLDTGGAPASNKNVKLTFGALATNATPAGLYSADLSLIATGKF
jgi:hypothetical protein